MELVHIKMRNGEDLLGYLASKDDLNIEVITPISIIIDPSLGMFAKSWLMFSEVNAVKISKNDYICFNLANKKAIDYYEEFLHSMNEKEQRSKLSEDSEFTNELEDVFNALAESRLSKIH
jgi:hypothetical protein